MPVGGFFQDDSFRGKFPYNGGGRAMDERRWRNPRLWADLRSAEVCIEHFSEELRGRGSIQ
jgi:hypothetical protein